MDQEIFHFINYTMSNVVLDFLMPLVSNKWIWGPLYLIFIWIAYKKFKVQAWKPILFILLSYLLTELSSNAFKHLLKRQRPNQIEGMYAIKRVEGGSGYATPSAHAANHFAIALVVGVVLFLGKSWRILLLIWAVLIGFSRIYNGVHFPSDVLTGFALGGLIAFLLILVWQKAVLKSIDL